MFDRTYSQIELSVDHHNSSTYPKNRGAADRHPVANQTEIKISNTEKLKYQSREIPDKTLDPYKISFVRDTQDPTNIRYRLMNKRTRGREME